MAPFDIAMEALEALLAAGDGGVLASPLKTYGSVPTPLFSRLVVRPDKSFAGTVGGGPMERDCLVAARAAVVEGASFSPVVCRFDLAVESGGESICGGGVSILLE
jgi:xanthine dehydrogenase accessory factor